MAVSERVERIQKPADLAVRHPYSRLPNWLYPAFVVVALSLFGAYAVLVVFFQTNGYFAPYLSPFYSPLIKVGPIPPGVWVAWAPLAFRPRTSTPVAVSQPTAWLAVRAAYSSLGRS